MIFSVASQVGATVAKAVTPDHDLSVRGGLDMATFESTTENLTPYHVRYFARFPERKVAAMAVRDAIRKGDLVRPRTCSACGTYSALIQGHHDDYSKPLEVRWLCPSCHHHADEARDGALADPGPVQLVPRILIGIALIECPGCSAEMRAASSWTAWTCWACRRTITQGSI